MWEVVSKDKLPSDINLECPICYDPIDINEIYKSVPNCKVCVNGHRWHNYCHSLEQYTSYECPLCRSTDVKYCKTRDGYSYNKKGGKRKKSRSKKYTKKSYKKKTRRRYYKKHN